MSVKLPRWPKRGQEVPRVSLSNFLLWAAGFPHLGQGTRPCLPSGPGGQGEGQQWPPSSSDCLLLHSVLSLVATQAL